ncbi:2-aminoethanethiol dioxygenase-like [Antedon mediterranea]|uniref:2-aminoethanethiol dioxygenase-like n=1 Tax=Antedon mediterranea TaxID=105859 RepID=UPI003AF89707
MAALTINKVVSAARETFKTILSDKTVLMEHLQKLKICCNEIKASDLNITAGVTQELFSSSSRPADRKPPVSYMHLYEDEGVSMGVFFLRGGSRIPLHNHPNMYGLCKVLYGTINVQSFSPIVKDNNLDIPEFNEFQQQEGRPTTPRELLTPTKHYVTDNVTSDSDVCLLLPDVGNCHELKAVDGPAAFVDILAPPYAPDEGRDCMYYKLLTAKKGGDIKWLLEIPPPAEFWTDEIPYTGPEIK